MADGRQITAPKVKSITSEFTFDVFDSLLLIDAGSSGFRVTDSNGIASDIPTGIPISVSAKAGQSAGPFTVSPPTSGTLNVTAIYYL